MSTKQPKKYTIDAAGMPLGRVASEVASLLHGKREVDFAPNVVPNVIVEVQNLLKLSFSGAKFQDKLYHRYTGYPGGLRTETLEKRWTKNPERLFQHTVEHMLPKNKLRKPMMKRLVISL